MLEKNRRNGPFRVHRIDPPVGVTRDRQLAAVALFKWTNEMAGNLKEVALVTGYHYAHVRRWRLPLFDGKITRSEFSGWKRKRMADKSCSQAKQKPGLSLGPAIGPATAARQRRLATCDLGLVQPPSVAPPQNGDRCVKNPE